MQNVSADPTICLSFIAGTIYTREKNSELFYSMAILCVLDIHNNSTVPEGDIFK